MAPPAPPTQVHPSERDAVSWLQRHAHSMTWDLPKYEDVGQAGPAHQPIFSVKVTVGPVVTEADGPSKKIAKQNAARQAMGEIRNKGHVPVEKQQKIKSHTQGLHELAQRQGWNLTFPHTERGKVGGFGWWVW
jgi:hypothetical protein